MGRLQQTWKKLNEDRSETPELISYQTTRRAIGWLGILLPVVLLLGSFLFDNCCVLQPSISHYYYTNMREIFVGVLCSVSLFLFTYKGYTPLDSIAANAAGLFCLGIAIFPTGLMTGFECQREVKSIIFFNGQSTVHYISAGSFFVTLALTSFFLFTKSKLPVADRTPEKYKRNVVYRICAIIMVLSLIVILLANWVWKVPDHSHLTYWMESVALVAFGVSWLTKGEALFGD
jgi:hypothetical protein